MKGIIQFDYEMRTFMKRYLDENGDVACDSKGRKKEVALSNDAIEWFCRDQNTPEEVKRYFLLMGMWV